MEEYILVLDHLDGRCTGPTYPVSAAFTAHLTSRPDPPSPFR